jgi:hypothetical protein
MSGVPCRVPVQFPARRDILRPRSKMLLSVMLMILSLCAGIATARQANVVAG